MRALVCIVSLSVIAAAAVAQTSGISQDGSRPADGAITGGKPIVPGESAGMPNKDVTTDTSAARLERCNELTGSLREECLRKQGSAGGGSTAPREQDKIEAPKIEVPK